jgi:hypothetical protein
MKRILSAFTAALAIGSIAVTLAAGATANVSWVAPTSYTDGSAIGATDIDHYTLNWAPAVGQAPGPSGSVNIPAGILTAHVAVACGVTTFTVSVTTSTTARFPNVTSAFPTPPALPAPQTLRPAWLRSERCADPAVSDTALVEDDETGSGDAVADRSHALVLLFTADGHAILEEEGEACWFSDDDDDFATEYGDEFLSPDEDAVSILNYLEDEGYLDATEKGLVQIDEEGSEEEE